jgi:hypothetical protein
MHHPSEHGWIAEHLRAPEMIAQHHHGTGPWPIVFGHEVAAQRRTRAEQAERIGRHLGGGRRLGPSAGVERHA